MVYREEHTYKVLGNLVERGWIPLSNMATLLGYSAATTIYQRQKTRSKIPTIRVGGQNRVYEDTVIELLTEKNTHHTNIILSLYKRIKSDV